MVGHTVREGFVRGGRSEQRTGRKTDAIASDPVLDLRDAAARVDLGNLATDGATRPLQVGKALIWFTRAHGAIVDPAPFEPRSLPRRRPGPVRILPPSVPLLAGRDREHDLIRESIAQGIPIQILGPHGAGKTALLRRVAHD